MFPDAFRILYIPQKSIRAVSDAAFFSNVTVRILFSQQPLAIFAHGCGKLAADVASVVGTRNRRGSLLIVLLVPGGTGEWASRFWF